MARAVQRLALHGPPGGISHIDDWLRDTQMISELLAALRSSQDAQTPVLDRVIAYIEGAMRSGGVTAAIHATAFERGHRDGLQHALNAIQHEMQQGPAPPAPVDFRNGCACQCCDHDEGSDCGCDCHYKPPCGFDLSQPACAHTAPESPR